MGSIFRGFLEDETKRCCGNANYQFLFFFPFFVVEWGTGMYDNSTLKLWTFVTSLRTL
jgi:hypothetical protein